jgi:hypothetical protein
MPTRDGKARVIGISGMEWISMVDSRKRLAVNATRAAEREAKRSMTPKQIRARARRGHGMNAITAREQQALLRKPMEEWDLEELARGRPKDKNGRFSGAAPKWITREMHEKSIDLFKSMIRTDMQSMTVKALKVLENILDDDEYDDKGKPAVPPGVRVDIAKFLLEHLIGKPTQPIEADISLKLQGVLASVLVQPSEMTPGLYQPSASHRQLEEADEDIEDAEVVEDG